jgi:Zn-dependent protease
MFGLSRLSPVQLVVLLVIGVVVFGAPILRSLTDPLHFVSLILGLIVGITVHEASHATVAVLLGDPTPRLMGRVSLNPLRHLDPMGSIAMLIASFGWGKPVVFNPSRLHGDPRIGSALVAAAGPISNVVTALIGAIVLERAGWSLFSMASRSFRGPAEPWVEILAMVVVINIGLAAFNLIPIPPLDGYGFVTNLLPKSMAVLLRPLETYGPLILLAIIFLGPSLLHVDILGSILRPIQSAIIFLMQPVLTIARTGM